MRLSILFCLAAFMLLQSCSKKQSTTVAKSELQNYDFNSEQAKELYKQCVAYELTDAIKQKEFALKLINLNDGADSKIIGNYFALLSDFNAGKSEALDQLKELYKQIPQRKYDKLRLRIDFLAISYYYHTYYYEGIAERINYLSKYITRPEHWLERATFRIFIDFQDGDKDYDRLITDFEKIRPKLNNYPWGVYQNLIYRSVAKTYARKKDTITAKKMYNYAKEENVKSNNDVLNISILTELFFTLDNNLTFLNEAETIALKTGHTLNLSLIYRLKGHYYFNLKNYNTAFEQYDTAAKKDSLYNEAESYVYSNIYRGWAYFKKNPSRETFNKTLTYYNLAKQKSELVKEPKNYLQEIINRKIWALDEIGTEEEQNKAKGEYYNLQYSKIGQKFTSTELKKVVASLNLKLNIKDNEVDYLIHSETNNRQKIEAQRVIMLLGAIALLLLLSLIGFNYHRLKKAQELKSKNKIIKSQNIKLQTSIQQLSKNTTILNQTNAQLEDVLERRDKIIKRLKQFTYTLAHDLSDPLLAIKTFGFLLNKTATSKLTNKEAEFLDVILDASMRLSDKVERLYKYSTNTLILFNDFKPINVNKIINGIKQDLSLIIQDKKAQITCDNIPPIKGDEVLINQLFQNLISNALKFNKIDEHPVINIYSYEEKNELIIVVKDNGIGIEKQDTDIFELFQRAIQDKKTKGKGIGLAIAKETVEIHSGRIWFESDPVNGTTFYIAFKEYGKHITKVKLFEAAEV